MKLTSFFDLFITFGRHQMAEPSQVYLVFPIRMLPDLEEKVNLARFLKRCAWEPDYPVRIRI